MATIEELRTFIERGKLASKNYRVWECESSGGKRTQSPMKVGKDAWRGILFDEEVRIELGGPKIPSSVVVFCTQNLQEIHPGRVTLIGPDLADIDQPMVPFGGIFLVAGQSITREMLNKVRRTVFLSNEIEGFSQRSVSRQFWYRVSKSIISRGASFLHLGEAFSTLFTGGFPGIIEGVEAMFITQNDSLVRELSELEVRVKETFTEAFREKIASYAKLRDDCDFSWGCDICDYQPVCEEIRDIIRIRDEKAAKEKQEEEL